MTLVQTRPDTHGHTLTDHDALTAAGVDPSTTQPREHAVRCHSCNARTFNQAGGCEAHYTQPAAIARTRNAERVSA